MSGNQQKPCASARPRLYHTHTLRSAGTRTLQHAHQAPFAGALDFVALDKALVDIDAERAQRLLAYIGYAEGDGLAARDNGGHAHLDKAFARERDYHARIAPPHLDLGDPLGVAHVAGHAADAYIHNFAADARDRFVEEELEIQDLAGGGLDAHKFAPLPPAGRTRYDLPKALAYLLHVNRLGEIAHNAVAHGGFYKIEPALMGIEHDLGGPELGIAAYLFKAGGALIPGAVVIDNQDIRDMLAPGTEEVLFCFHNVDFITLREQGCHKIFAGLGFSQRYKYARHVYSPLRDPKDAENMFFVSLMLYHISRVYSENMQRHRSKTLKNFPFILLILLTLLSLPIARVSAAGIQMPEEESATIRRGIEFLYNLEYEAALTNFAALLPKWKDHPAPWFFTAMVWWIKWSQDDEIKRSGDIFMRHIEVAMEKARAILARSPKDSAGIFYLAGSLGFAGRHAFAANNLPKAISSGWEAYQLLKKNESSFDEDKDVLLGHGIFNFYAGRLPESAKAFARLLGVQGDWRLGLDQLKQVMNEGTFARTEAEYTLSYVYTYDLRDGNTGSRYSKGLMDRYPRNPEFRLQYGENLLSMGRHAAAKELIEEGLALIEQGFYKTIPRFRFYSLLGKITLSERKYEDVLRWLNLAIACPEKGSGNYLAWAHVRRGDAFMHFENKRAAQADYKRAAELDAGGSAASAAEQRLKRMN